MKFYQVNEVGQEGPELVLKGVQWEQVVDIIRHESEFTVRIAGNRLDKLLALKGVPTAKSPIEPHR